MASIFRGIRKTLNAPARIKSARERYEVAHKAYQKKYEDYKAYSAVTREHLERLGQIRADGMREVREAVEFLRQFKSVHLKDSSAVWADDAQMEEMEKLDKFYGTILGSVGGGTAASAAGGVGVGAMAALGAYGLAGAIGVASTGTAISTLSGAAATSATLAWLGGGALAAGGAGMVGGMAVLGGITAVPAFVAVGLYLKSKADKVEREVEQKLQEIQDAEDKIEQDLAYQEITRQRAEELRHTIATLIEELKAAVGRAKRKPNLFQGFHRMVRQILRTLTRRPKVGLDDAAIYQVIQIAKALRDAIDEPVVKRPQA